MTGLQTNLDLLLFVAFPYVALATFCVMTVLRYRAAAFTYSSLSSQLLENRSHFWALVPFHYGIITILAGHLVGLAVPRTVLAWNSRPLRLYVLEVAALAFGMLTLVGLVNLVWRRLRYPSVRAVTSAADWLVYVLLLLQVGTGASIAVFYPWGSSWFAATAVPYLWSILTLQPDVAQLAVLSAAPLLVKLHLINAFVLIGLVPFTRLVHILVVPNPYLWRKPQVVRWYG